MEHTLALIGRAHQGDKEARDTLFEENTGLIYSVARRFLGRGVEMEDLFQIGSIGLLKAVDKFDPAFEVRFSTYAIPMILGELKRFFRDDGMIKVSRSIKENQHRVYLAREKIEKASDENNVPEARGRNGDVADDAVVLSIIVTRESLRGTLGGRSTTQSLRTCQILPTNAGGISPTVCRQYFAAVNSRKKGGCVLRRHPL